MVEDGTQVTGKLAHDQFFDRAAGPWSDPDPLANLYTYQERHLGAIMGKLCSPYNASERTGVWS